MASALSDATIVNQIESNRIEFAFSRIAQLYCIRQKPFELWEHHKCIAKVQRRTKFSICGHQHSAMLYGKLRLLCEAK